MNPNPILQLPSGRTWKACRLTISCSDPIQEIEGSINSSGQLCFKNAKLKPIKFDIKLETYTAELIEER
jgi:hypothetical protein